MKSIRSLFIILFCLVALPLLALTQCPRCGYRIGASDLKCAKCLKNLSTDWSQIKAVKSTITVRRGTDAFIRHPHADNRAFKAARNAGGDNLGEIGCWGGKSTLRYLANFAIKEAMDMQNVDYQTFVPKKATLFLSAVPKKSNVEVPVAVYPLINQFEAGHDCFRTREKRARNCTWYYRDTAMMWDVDGGDYEHNCVSRGVIKSGERNAIDITSVIKHMFEKAKLRPEFYFNGFIIMSDPADNKLESGFVSIYSFDETNYTLRPELYIE